jgi:hypothetical protein
LTRCFAAAAFWKGPVRLCAKAPVRAASTAKLQTGTFRIKYLQQAVHASFEVSIKMNRLTVRSSRPATPITRPSRTITFRRECDAVKIFDGSGDILHQARAFCPVPARYAMRREIPVRSGNNIRLISQSSCLEELDVVSPAPTD